MNFRHGPNLIIGGQAVRYPAHHPLEDSIKLHWLGQDGSGPLKFSTFAAIQNGVAAVTTWPRGHETSSTHPPSEVDRPLAKGGRARPRTLASASPYAFPVIGWWACMGGMYLPASQHSGGAPWHAPTCRLLLPCPRPPLAPPEHVRNCGSDALHPPILCHHSVQLSTLGCL